MDSVTVIANILVTLCVAYYQIREGRKLNAENRKTNEENAGKNRVIYSVEQMDIARDSKDFDTTLNKKLSSGDYTILAAVVDRGNTSQTRYVLGKIKS
jgi:hypothetical protein